MDGAKQIKDMSCMLLTKGEKKYRAGSLLKLESVKDVERNSDPGKEEEHQKQPFSVFYAKRLKILNYILIVTLKRKVKDGERLVYRPVYITQKKKYIQAVCHIWCERAFKAESLDLFIFLQRGQSILSTNCVISLFFMLFVLKSLLLINYFGFSFFCTEISYN
jgi:hypothetical protein